MTELDDDNIDLTPKYKGRLTWDLLAHNEVQAWLPKLGLVPPSAEGLELDHVEAHARPAAIQPLAGLVAALSSLCSEIHAAYVIGEVPDELLPTEDLREEARESYADLAFTVAQSCTLAVIAELMQEHILDFGSAVTRV